jgi:hypothetical protein
MSMRMRLILLLLILFALPLRGAGDGSYRLNERITVLGNGAGEVTCTITPDSSLRLPMDIPFDRGIPRTAIGASDSSVSAQFLFRDGIPMLHLTGSRSSEEPLVVTVQVDSLPVWRGLKTGEFGNRTVVLRFRNTTPRMISQYTGALILPRGLTVTSVVSSEPAQTEKEPAAPYTIFDTDEGSGISIHKAGMGLSDAARVTFRCKPAQRSPVLLICCSLVGVLYLIFFRNVLKDNGNGSSVA